MTRKMCLYCIVFLSFQLFAAKDSPFELGKKAYDSGKFGRALDLFGQVIAGESGSLRNQAYYYQGLIFFEMSFYYSSYVSFNNVLSSGDDRNRDLFEKSIKNVVIIADKLGIVEQLGKLLDKLPGSLVAPSVSALNHYAIGIYQLSSGNDTEAASHLKSVSPESAFYKKALFNLGVLATRRKDYKEAKAYFSKTVELTRGNQELFPIQELARLNLARVLYSGGEIERSVEVYSQFVSSSIHWITVLLEASWPLMRVNDTTISLGNLHTITSPFYQNQLVGEAHILRSTILFNLCKYEEMRRTLADFFEVYDPITRMMQEETTRFSGGDTFYKALVSGKLNRAFTEFVKRDAGIARDIKVLELLRNERRNLSKYRLKQVESIKEKIEDAEKQISLEMGTVLEKLHKRKLAELLEQREQANYLKVEIVSGEKDLIEGQKGLPPKRVVDVETTVAKGFEFWPFHGEYWEDEMGAYVYTTESACVR